MLGLLAFSAGATFLMTWPVGLHLSDHLVVPRVFIGRGLLPNAPDTYLHLWILAWVHHALTTEPARLFDANIMYPARHALAGSEHMLAHWPLHAPVYAASGNPVLAYQWVLFSSFVLNTIALYTLLRRWTASAQGALVGAAIYAFAPLRFDLIGTVQHLNVAYLPLAVFFSDRYRREGRRRDLAGVAAATALQTLCSYYLAYATAVAVVILCLAVALEGPRRALALGGAAVVGLVPLAAVSLPYLRMRAAAVVPVYPDVWLRAASASPAWFVRRDMPLFAGGLPLALAIAGALSTPVERWRRWFALGVVAAGGVLVLGPVVPLWGWEIPLPYRALYAWIPGFASLRYPYRFGVLTTLGIALLAGLGWSRLVGSRTRGWPLTALGLFVVGMEYRRAPLQLQPVEVGSALPPAYHWLARHGAGRPLLDWPIPPPGDLRAGYEQSRAMYFSTYHWLPLLNGYTAYEPPSHEVVSLLAQRLPEPRSLQELIDLTGVRLLLLHRDRLDPAARERWSAWLEGAGGCEQLAEFAADVICALPAPRTDLRPRLVAADERTPRETFRGLPLAPLPPRGQRGRLAAERGAPTMAAGLVQRLRLEATNRSSVPWPGLAPPGPGVVMVRQRWRMAEDGTSEPEWRGTPLLCDLAPGESCQVVLPILAPSAPGSYVLELALGQEAGPEIPLEGATPLRLPVRVLRLSGARAAR